MRLFSNGDVWVIAESAEEAMVWYTKTMIGALRQSLYGMVFEEIDPVDTYLPNDIA